MQPRFLFWCYLYRLIISSHLIWPLYRPSCLCLYSHVLIAILLIMFPVFIWLCVWPYGHLLPLSGSSTLLGGWSPMFFFGIILTGSYPFHCPTLLWVCPHVDPLHVSHTGRFDVLSTQWESISILAICFPFGGSILLTAVLRVLGSSWCGI